MIRTLVCVNDITDKRLLRRQDGIKFFDEF